MFNMEEAQVSFLNEFASTDDGLRELLEDLGYTFDGDEDISDVAIKEDYIWLEKRDLWVKKTNIMYIDFDEFILEKLLKEETDE